MLFEELIFVDCLHRIGVGFLFLVVGFVKDESHRRLTAGGAFASLVENRAQLDGALQMRRHVTLAVPGCSKHGVAVRAFEWSGARVETHVHFETSARRKERVADMTTNVFRARVVSSDMRFQGRLDRKGFAAVIAFERLFSGVDSNVPSGEKVRTEFE